MKFIVLLQARTNSTRLPGKVLMKIRGIPIVVLAYNRASNKGANVRVVTSKNDTDDRLVETLQENKIPFFRGDLDNPLKRFFDSLKKESDNTIIVRLTADNVFPDGALIEDVVEDFCKRKVNYLFCNGLECGFPHGVSIEVTLVKFIREAFNKGKSAHDKEHVTPYISRKYGINYYKSKVDIPKSNLSCTIDTTEDYERILKLFDSIDNPNQVPVKELVSLL